MRSADLFKPGNGMHRCRASHHLSTSRTFCTEQGSALTENNSRKLTSNFKCSQDSSWVQICPRDRCLTKWKSTAKIWQELWLTKRWGKVFVLLRQAHLRQPPPTKRCIQLPNESEWLDFASSTECLWISTMFISCYTSITLVLGARDLQVLLSNSWYPMCNMAFTSQSIVSGARLWPLVRKSLSISARFLLKPRIWSLMRVPPSTFLAVKGERKVQDISEVWLGAFFHQSQVISWRYSGFAVTDLNPQYFRVSRQCGGQQPDVCDLKASWVESQLLR